MKRTKAFLAALSALCVTFSATGIAFAAPEDNQIVATASDEYLEEQNNENITNSEGDTAEDYEASIGDDKYVSFIAALGAAQSGQTVTLLKNISYESENRELISLNTPDVTIDLNGKVLDFTHSEFNVQAKGITIKGGIIKSKGGIITTNDGQITVNGKSLQIQSGGGLKLEGVTINCTGVAVWVKGGNLDINNCNIGNATAEGQNSMAMQVEETNSVTTIDGSETFISGSIKVMSGAKLIVKDGNITAPVANAIYGDGTVGKGNTTIDISGGTIISKTGTGIYLPQNGTVNISGGDISGANTALEVASGKLTITDGSFTCTGDEIAINPNPKATGAKYAGAALAVFGRTNSDRSNGYAGDAEINISGGIFTGPQGFVKALDNGKSESTSIKSINITGGTFIGTGGEAKQEGLLPGVAVYVDPDCKDNKFISGGTFESKNKENADITPYLADGTAYSDNGNGEYAVYSSANKITGAGTYRTISNDGKYDQLTMESKEISTPTQVSDIGFNVTIGNNDTKTYNYTNQTTVAEGTVLFGLIVTDIPEGETVTVDLK